jgi:hypothetical protein
MRRTSTARAGGRGGKGHALESALDEGGDAALEEKLKRMEEEAVRVVGAVFEVKKQTHMLPLVLQVLEQRIGVQADEGDTPASQALPAPTADDAAKKEGVKSQRRGSGLFGCAAARAPARPRRPPPDAAASRRRRHLRPQGHAPRVEGDAASHRHRDDRGVRRERSCCAGVYGRRAGCVFKRNA